MNIEEARGFVFQALRQDSWNQFGNVLASVGDISARARNIQRTQYMHGDGRQFLNEDQKSLVLEVVWSLIVQGILIPGLNDSNQGWPFLRLTEYGRQCIIEDRILPHDPEGYLKDFRREVPTADHTVIEYLTESLQCYIHGLCRASAIMLGGASEQSVLLLIESYINSIADPNAKQTFQSSVQKTQSIFRKYELFKRQLLAVQRNMPRELTENLESLLGGIFDMIRSSRNDAGHPASGNGANRDVVYSHLRLFPPYCKRIQDLIVWFSANSI
jgi:hypothetical protein